ncbi:protease3 [Piscirickettsia salmonis]|uniref:Metalloenzyme, LuxS n=1 Tax=Piscirickettsia salmonis TaxID=1238 RepID=A0A1L6TAV3_PISSA|nr:insulinase family protein [Piscirickettsia salmonis]AKP73645.1 peptidase M16 [Piscirickettsia salmonis LF-89 = ATCC VR-1361]ALB22423.1 Metalloenzyme, LuxS [Piscirickettsia salmonis]ALY02494.1 peptidase M16 [Piscirickettsia salmonis]AMA42015.1 peptidase M16 [Piscirickettsia salmonis]AOS34485.1 peptidase M16 [Piscirickettsia salmonis]
MTLNLSKHGYETFEYLRDDYIPALNVTVTQYRHRQTGAEHYHIDADNAENVFLVGLRTVPTDSTGVAHILEHTALCGSEKYPVRDPFFMMIRRSLNTFMNAFTSSDWTAYPFATQNKKDFNNLLDVYLDAVFFSRLDPLDFAQEGHRLVFSEENNMDSPLMYKGVVYNEMKGALSSPSQQLWYILSSYLFPTSTYHYNSGGDPECITDLSYDELKAFYKKHYHPSNAVFMTYGNISASEHQQNFEEKVLSRFERSDDYVEVKPEKRYHAPVSIARAYPLDTASSGRQSYHVLAWLLGESVDLKSAFKAHLLSSVLLDNSASPLMAALEQTDLGSAPAPICGLEDSNREISFMCGLEGCAPESAEAFKTLVLNVLEKVAKDGIGQEKLAAALHQFELSQREVTGDGYPYGLKLILSMLTASVHRGDAIAAINIEPVLDELREEIKDPNFIKHLVQESLLNNPHQVLFTLNPDEKLTARKAQTEEKYLAELKGRLSTQAKQQMVELANKLKARQEAADDPGILPKVTLNDVPGDIPKIEGLALNESGKIQRKYYTQGTNGLVYQQIVVDMPELNEEELKVLPLYTACLPELGAGELSYIDVQEAQARCSGGFNAYTTFKGQPDNEQYAKGYFVLSGKALARNYHDFNELMQKLFNQVRFDESSRLRELIAQIRASREQSIVSAGHSFVMGAASSGMSPVAKLHYQLEGLAGVKALKALDESLSDKTKVIALGQTLAAIHSKVIANAKQLLMIGEENSQPLVESVQWQEEAAESNSKDTQLALASVQETVNCAWLMNTQVNFCSHAYKTVPSGHADAPVLTIIGGILRNGFLHRAVREQGGAYGGGATHDNDNGVLRFYSYRDPRLADTLNDFSASVEWLKKGEFLDEQIEESVLGVIAALDKPSSPAGEARQAFFNDLHGRSYEVRKRFRERALAVTREDIIRVARTYLNGDNVSTAVIASPALKSECEKLGLTVFNL